ncbi:MAG TPA: hypothetical protein EYH48_02120 [Aquifex aeolicus]|nr:hypothetical protein [Aquificales bacterium]HIQ26119.1 hypothetical protein [Aquifex aeolicus]
MRILFLHFLGTLFVLSCGKKAPPQPPPAVSETSHGVKKETITEGEGGYFIGDDGIVTLYWDFPVRVQLFEIYLLGKKVALTGDNFFVYPTPLKKGESYLFTIWAIKGGKRIGKVEIEVKY